MKHRDILTSTITASIAGAISTLANFGMLFGGNDENNRNPVFAILILIVNPLAGGGIAGLFSTHPSTEERVARLLALG